MAKQTIAVKQENGHFDPIDFLQKLAEIDCADVAGFMYGSGFEGNIALLDTIAKQLPLLGNLPQTFAQVNNPADFFKTLDLLEIPHPEVCFNQLDNASGWLVKHRDGSGGMHIKNALQDAPLNEGEYYQRRVSGVPVSLLFLADKNSAQVIGFNEQLIDATEACPYRYAGAISNYPLNQIVTEQLINYATRLTKYYALVGLNSLDVMVLDDNSWVLEINPRLSASSGLNQFDHVHLIDLHWQACAKNSVANDFKILLNSVNKSKGQHIFYAPFKIKINKKIAWPDWVVDIPVFDRMIEKSAPVCTVQAEGNTSNDVMELLAKRMQYLQTFFIASDN